MYVDVTEQLHVGGDAAEGEGEIVFGPHMEVDNLLSKMCIHEGKCLA